MIKLTRLNGSELMVNALVIERVEATPDTVVRLMTGAQLVVRETPDEVRDLTVVFLRSVHSREASATVFTQADILLG